MPSDVYFSSRSIAGKKIAYGHTLEVSPSENEVTKLSRSSALVKTVPLMFLIVECILESDMIINGISDQNVRRSMQSSPRDGG